MLTQHREGKFPPKYENEKMASFAKARDELVEAYDERTIEDNDFVLLTLAFRMMITKRLALKPSIR